MKQYLYCFFLLISLLIPTHVFSDSMGLPNGPGREGPVEGFNFPPGALVTAPSLIGFITPNPSWNGVAGNQAAPASSVQQITGTSSNGGLIELTVGSTSAFTTGNVVCVKWLNGTTEANGCWVVTVTNGTSLTLQNSTFTNNFVVGDMPTYVAVAYGGQSITTVASNGASPAKYRLTVSTGTSHLTTGDQYTVSGTGTLADGDWPITVVDSTHIDVGTTVQPGPTYVSGCSSSCGVVAFAEPVIAGLDEHSGAVIESNYSAGCLNSIPQCEYVTVGATVANRQGIASVTCYYEGNSAVATGMTENPKTGTDGYVFSLSGPADLQNGDAELVCDSVPVNGFARRLNIYTWINSQSGGAGYTTRTKLYVDPSGSNTTGCTGAGAGTVAAPIASLTYATSCAPAGAIVYVGTNPYTNATAYPSGFATVVEPGGGAACKGGGFKCSGGAGIFHQVEIRPCYYNTGTSACTDNPLPITGISSWTQSSVNLTASAVTTITATIPVSSTAGLPPVIAGENFHPVVTGTNIPANDTIVSYIPNTSITMALPVTGNISNGATLNVKFGTVTLNVTNSYTSNQPVLVTGEQPFEYDFYGELSSSTSSTISFPCCVMAGQVGLLNPAITHPDQPPINGRVIVPYNSVPTIVSGQLVNYEGGVFNMAYGAQWQTCNARANCVANTGSLPPFNPPYNNGVLFNNSALIDMNGPVGPPLGYYSVSVNLDQFTNNNSQEYFGIEDTLFATAAITGISHQRNIYGTDPWTNFIVNYNSNLIFDAFNIHVSMPTAGSTGLEPSIGAFNDPTTLMGSLSPQTINPANNQLTATPCNSSTTATTNCMPAVTGAITVSGTGTSTATTFSFYTAGWVGFVSNDTLVFTSGNCSYFPNGIKVSNNVKTWPVSAGGSTGATVSVTLTGNWTATATGGQSAPVCSAGGIADGDMLFVSTFAHPNSPKFAGGSTNSANSDHNAYMQRVYYEATSQIPFFQPGGWIGQQLAGSFAVKNGTFSLSTAANSGATVLDVASTTNYAVGNLITGTGIPANDTIASIQAGVSITLNSAITANIATSQVNNYYYAVESGNTTITVQSLGTLTPGDLLTATTGIPANDYVLSIAGNVITTSQAATAQNNGTISFTNPSPNQWITSSGTTVTINSANGSTGAQAYLPVNIQSGDYVHIVASAAHNATQYRQVVGIPCAGNTANCTVGTNGGLITIDRPFDPDITVAVAWNEGKTAVGMACVSCAMGGNTSGTGSNLDPEGQYQHGMENVFWIQTTVTMGNMFMRPGNTGANPQQSAGFGANYFVIYDTIWDAECSDYSYCTAANGWPQASQAIVFEGNGPTTLSANGSVYLTGVTMDNVDYEVDVNGSLHPGTNATVGTVTLNDWNDRPCLATYTTPPNGCFANITSSLAGATLSKALRGLQGGLVVNGTPLFPFTLDGAAISSGSLVGAMQP